MAEWHAQDQLTAVNGELVVPSTCCECSSHCGSLVAVKNGVVDRVSPNPAHPSSKGAFCLKGIRGTAGITYSESRVLKPLRRVAERGAGKWQEISWDEALEYAADKLAAVRRDYGPLSLVAAVSNANVSRGVTIALLMRSLGSPNWMMNQDLCGGCRAVSARASGLDITRGEDIEHTNCALVVGRNSYEANPIEWMALKKLKKRGGKLVVIDPKQTPAADMASLWLRPRPGTDAALALGIINILIEENLYDNDFVEQWCYGFEALRQRAAEFNPRRVEELTAVPSEQIIDAARMYAAGPSTFVSGHGIDAFSAGVQTFRAYHCLVAISGNVDRLGGNRRVKKPKGFRDNLGILHDPEFRLPVSTENQTIGASQFPLWAGPKGWQMSCHNPSVIQAMLTSKPYPVRALYVSGVNIVVTYPNTRKTVEALRSLDFLMVATDTMTPTAQLADVVLPKTAGFEENNIRLLPEGPAISMTQAAIHPRGEARNDLEIALALLEQMSVRGAITRNFFKWKNEEQFIEYMLANSGITLAKLRKDGFATFSHELGNFEASRFPSSTGKVELYSESLAEVGLDPLPSYTPPAHEFLELATREKFPLILLTGDREKAYHHSRFRDQRWAQAISPDPRLLVNPETAKELSIFDGQWIRLETPHTSSTCRLRVKTSNRTPPRVVSTGMGWWSPNDSDIERGIFDININAALTYDGAWDPASGSVDIRGIPCRLTPMGLGGESNGEN